MSSLYKNIENVTVEMVSASDVTAMKQTGDVSTSVEIISGQLYGLWPQVVGATASFLIVLKTAKNKFDLLNLDEYNVMSIFVHKMVATTHTFFKADNEDQLQAQDILVDIISTLTDEGKTTDSGKLIKCNTFKGVPDKTSTTNSYSKTVAGWGNYSTQKAEPMLIEGTDVISEKVDAFFRKAAERVFSGDMDIQLPDLEKLDDGDATEATEVGIELLEEVGQETIGDIREKLYDTVCPGKTTGVVDTFDDSFMEACGSESPQPGMRMMH